MFRVNKTLDNSKKSANKRGEDLIIRRFLSELLREQGNVAPGENYNYDPVDDLTDSMAGLLLNRVLAKVVKKAMKTHACSKVACQNLSKILR